MVATALEWDPWFIGAILAVAMFAGWWLGWRRGRQIALLAQAPPAAKFSDATLAILGLLLAFTFSMALSKHDRRREMVVNDSNAIGDFYTCASLLKAPVRDKLQQTIRQYLEHRLALVSEQLTEEQLQKKLLEIPQMHNQMQALVGEAVDGGTPLAVPLVNTLNALTSNHAARLAAARDRLPGSVVCLLFLSSVISLVLVGVQQGAAGEWRPGATIAFAILVSMVVWITLDFNQPKRGMLTVSQEPMQRLLAGMGQ